MKIRSINNPLYVALALQIAGEKEGYEIAPTYLNTSTITKTGFNPVFLVFRVVNNEEDLLSYIHFRITSGFKSGVKEFSSIEVINKTYDGSIWKDHIRNYTEIDSLIKIVLDKATLREEE